MNPYPQYWTEWQTNTENYNLLEQKPLWEPVPGEATWIITDELLEAQCGQIWELKMPEGQVILWPPNFHEFFYQEPASFYLY